MKARSIPCTCSIVVIQKTTSKRSLGRTQFSMGPRTYWADGNSLPISSQMSRPQTVAPAWAKGMQSQPRPHPTTRTAKPDKSPAKPRHSEKNCSRYVIPRYYNPFAPFSKIWQRGRGSRPKTRERVSVKVFRLDDYARTVYNRRISLKKAPKTRSSVPEPRLMCFSWRLGSWRLPVEDAASER
jgi:hypothetical protein